MFEHDNIKLKSCPFCGSNDCKLYFKVTDVSRYYGDDDRRCRLEAYVTCPKCNFEIPSSPDHSIYSCVGVDSYITPEDINLCMMSAIYKFNTRSCKEDSEDE